MKTTMTKKQVIQLVNTKASLNKSEDKLPMKFAYALNKNCNSIKGEFEALSEIDPFVKSHNERMAINVLMKESVKTGNRESVDEAIEKFNKKYEAEFQKWDELLEEEIEVELIKVKIDQFPEELTDANMENLMLMVED